MGGDFNIDFNNDFNNQIMETKETLKALISAALVGQGNQVDVGSKLPVILNGIIDLIPDVIDSLDSDSSTDALSAKQGKAIAEMLPETALMIESEGNTTAGSYQVPALTVEQVTQAYNAVVSGRGCIIVDHDETIHAYVNQADQLNDELSIGILFYSSLVLTYTISADAVVITYVELQSTEE